MYTLRTSEHYLSHTPLTYIPFSPANASHPHTPLTHTPLLPSNVGANIRMYTCVSICSSYIQHTHTPHHTHHTTPHTPHHTTHHTHTPNTHTTSHHTHTHTPNTHTTHKHHTYTPNTHTTSHHTHMHTTTVLAILKLYVGPFSLMKAPFKKPSLSCRSSSP